jgi:hypothetical protein
MGITFEAVARRRDRDTNGCYAAAAQLQVVTHIMTHRSEDFARKTESSVPKGR